MTRAAVQPLERLLQGNTARTEQTLRLGPRGLPGAPFHANAWVPTLRSAEQKSRVGLGDLQLCVRPACVGPGAGTSPGAPGPWENVSSAHSDAVREDVRAPAPSILTGRAVGASGSVRTARPSREVARPVPAGAGTHAGRGLRCRKAAQWRQRGAAADGPGDGPGRGA